MTYKDEESKSLAVPIALDVFIRHIDSLVETLPLTMVVIQSVHVLAIRRYRKFVEDFCEIETVGEKEYINVARERLYRFEKLNKRVERVDIAARTVPQSFVVSLVSHYDFFLGRLVKALYLLKPEKLKASDRTLTISQLLEFNSIDDAQEYVLEKEIETLLRKSHSEQFDWLENKFSISLRKNLEVWPTFIEVTERRNLFVHAGGVVSSQYLKVCRDNGYELDPSVTVGTELGVSRGYFETAYRAVYEIAVKLTHVLWRKIQPGTIQEADRHLSNKSYDLLKEDKNQLAAILLDFATDTLKKHSDEEARLVFIVNKAQAYKWSGNEEAVQKIIVAEDWSATSDKFKIAKAVLTNDFKEASNIMRRIGPDGIPSKSDYRDWPLFKEYRKSDEFLKTFEEVFGEPFSEFEKEAKLLDDEGQDLFDVPDEAPPS